MVILDMIQHTLCWKVQSSDKKIKFQRLVNKLCLATITFFTFSGQEIEHLTWSNVLQHTSLLRDTQQKKLILETIFLAECFCILKFCFILVLPKSVLFD